MDKKLKILHLEDSQSDAALVGRVLKKGNVDFESRVVDTKEEYVKGLKEFLPDIILSDHSLPSFNSHEALVILKETGKKIPFILITANVSEEFAVDVIKRGADDYILKDRLERLPAAIQNSLDKFFLESERQSYLDEIIRNEQHYRALIKNIHDGIILINENKEITYQSPSVENITGFAFEELKDKKIFDHVHPEDRRECSALFQRAQQQPGIPLYSQYRVLHSKGHYFWTEGTITNLLCDESVKAYIVNYRDITERKKAEGKIIHANRLFAFVSHINQAIVHVGDQQAVFNEACCIAIDFGKFKAAWIGLIDAGNKKIALVAECGLMKEDIKRFKDISYENNGPQGKVLRTGSYYVSNDMQNEPEPNNWKLFASDRGYGSCIVLPIRKSGNITGTFNLYAPETNFFDAEEIALVSEVTNDISFIIDVFENTDQRKLAEEAGKKAELETLKVYGEKNIILESIGDAFFAVDKNWTVTYWNNQAEKMLGTPKDKIVGRRLWAVFPDSINSESYRQYHLAVETGEVIRFEDYYAPLEKWYEISAFPSDNGLSVYFKDVTERKLSEIRLNEMNRDLNKYAKELAISNSELGQFAYAASHDLQEPLRMVTSFMTLLEKKYSDVIDDKGKQYIDFAVDGAKRMRQIILDLLEFSQIGKAEDKLEEVDLNEIVNEIVMLHRKQIQGKKAVLKISKLPVLTASRTPMRQVFQNLISNGLKYQKDGVLPELIISSEDKKGYWEFAIADNGIGIGSAYFDKVFVIFQRLHTRAEYPGTGIGLAITRKIIENAGGKIWLESEEGKGSKFYFTIPKLIKTAI